MRRIQLPEKIKIGSFVWDVKLNDNLMHEREERAVCRPKRLLIEIDPGCEIVAQEEGLIHEILEAICWQYNIQFESHKDLSIMATVLHQVIKENPHMFSTFLTADV